MAWTTPRDWVPGEIVTAAIMNTHIRDNERYLKGIGQIPTTESGLRIDSTDGDEYFRLPTLTSTEIDTALAGEVARMAYDETTNHIRFGDDATIKAIVSNGDVDDTPVNGATTDPISSNWAYDHITDADQHPEYQKESLLTTQGDIPYATGASAWARLAKGTALQTLSMNSGATAPEWGTPQTVTIADVASDTLRNSNDTSQVTASATYVKKKEVLLNDNLPICRIKMTLTPSASAAVYGRIYKNGVAIGTERTVGAGGGATEFSEDFATFVATDLIQIYVHSDGTFNVWVQDMRFYYDRQVTQLGGETLQTTVLTSISAISMTNQDP